MSSAFAYSQSTVSSYPTLTANNGSGGVTFEAVVGQNINIISYTSALYTTANLQVQIWYRPGGVLHPSATTPVISTATGWILHETTTVTAASTTVPHSITLVNQLALAPGTYGFAVGNNSTTARYMTYSATVASTFTDGTLTMNTGVGKGWGGTFPNPTIATRSFVGSLTYTLAPTSPNNAGVTSIDSPAGGCEGDYNVVVTIKNFGINQIDTVTVEWAFNGVPQNPVEVHQLLDTFGGLGPSSIQVSLDTVSLVGGNTDTIVAWTSMPNNVVDSVTDDDTASAVFTSLSTLTTLPYYQDFEAGQGEWFIGGSNPSWAYGTPAKTTIIGASSGTKAFVTGGLGTTMYNINEKSDVGSPCFDFTQIQGSPWVAMNIWWNSEFSFDGAVLQTSVDGGKTWANVGKHLDPNKWYNDNTIAGNPGGQQEGWSGRASSANGSGGWVFAKHALDKSLIGNKVRFRVAFGEDGSIVDDGFAFDNFTIVDLQKPNMGQDTISFCGSPSLTLDPNIAINGEFKWFDGDSTSTTKVVNSPGIYWVEYTDTLINEMLRDTIEVVQSPAPVISFDKSIDTISVDDYITLDPHLPFDRDYTWTPGNHPYPYLLVKGSEYGPGTHLFNLVVTDSVLCEDNENVTVVILDYTGIDESGAPAYKVYPNPVEHVLNIFMRGEDHAVITLLDQAGRIVYNRNASADGTSIYQIDMGSLSPGNYILLLNINGEIHTEKIIKTGR